MLSLSSLDLNPVLAALKVSPDDKLIAIKEVGLADSNFVITHIIKKIFQSNGKLCLVLLHNNLTHYQMVGKKLGYDLIKKIEAKEVVLLEPLEGILTTILTGDFTDKKQRVLDALAKYIEQALQSLEGESTNLIIDDLSHFLDLNIDISYVINFVNKIININPKVCVILNNHCLNSDVINNDTIISNYLSYVADLKVEVLPLKTGRSTEVTGVFNVIRKDSFEKYHFKSFERGIKTFKPGESLLNLYK